MNKYGARAACTFLFFLGSVLGITAQNLESPNTDIPTVIAGVLHALEYAEYGYDDDESGSTIDESFTWDVSPANGGLRLTFSGFRYSFLYGARGESSSAELNGTLTCEDFILNGTLFTGGLSFSSVRFNDLDASQTSETGGITAGGVFYSQERITQIIDDLDEQGYNFDTDKIITWERECVFAGLLTFMSSMQLAWEDGTNVLDSLYIEDMENRPAEGQRVSNEEKTLTATVMRGGNRVEFTYSNFTVQNDEFPLKFTVTGRLLVGMYAETAEEDIESISFDGSAVFRGLASVSSMEIKDCVIREACVNEGIIPGAVIIDGKTYKVQDFFPVLARIF
jgi:hypothetical protein